MATSGTYLFNPTLAEVVDEAFERCGVDPASLTGRHLRSARASMNFMNTSWANQGVHLWKMELTVLPFVVGQATYTLPVGTIDVIEGALRSDNIDTPMTPLSHEGYLAVHDKALQGRPDRYHVQRDIAPTITFWQVPDDASESFVYWRFQQLEDAARLTNLNGIPYRWHEAFVSGLAAKLALKWSLDRLNMLMTLAGIEFLAARYEDRERADITICPGRES